MRHPSPLLLLVALALIGCTNPLAGLFGYSGLTPLPLPEQAYAVMASPDGAQLAYTERGGLSVVDLATMSTRRLLQSTGTITVLGWTGDGRRMLILPTYPAPVLQPGEPKPQQGPPFPPARLQFIDVATGALTSPAIAGSVIQAAPSPDGQYLALRTDGGLMLYDVEQDRQSTLVQPGGWWNVVWSPDSKRLAYPEFKDDGGRIVVVTVPDGQLQRLEAGVRDHRMGAEMSCYPYEEKLSWSEDGTQLQVVQGRDPRTVAITRFGLDGAQLQDRTVSVADPAAPRRWVDCYHPSPDGRYAVAIRMSGEPMLPQPASSLIGIDIGASTVRDVAPAGGFITWLGHSSRFVMADHQGGRPRYFIADAAAR